MITKKQNKVLTYIKSYMATKGYSPSLEDIRKHFKLSSVSTAHHYIKKLEESGYLEKENNHPRSIHPSDVGMTNINIVGSITAGQPIEAIEYNFGAIAIPNRDLDNSSDYYALKVLGESMIDDGIFNGDLVVIKKQESADNGQTVVAVIDDNEATLKKIYREKGRFRLQPANQSMLPFYRKEVEIRGVVVKIIRELEDNNSKLINIIRKEQRTLNSTRKSTTKINDKAKPFIQWVGGKREMIGQYKKYLPKKFNRYFEPFLGGGAMFFYLQPKKSILADNNIELIKTYEAIRDNPEGVINILLELKSRHSKTLYNTIRSIDRTIDIFSELDNTEIAARMIFLNQTCFNGLYRVNKQGQFNVPIGSSLNRLICDENGIRNASKLLRDIIIKYSDFDDILSDAKKGDFIYLDPPYYPVSAFSDFTRYTKEKFYQEDQIRLKKKIDKLNKMGCKIMLSNSNCDFIKKLYSNYKQRTVLSSRSLNCKKDKRGKVTELLITNY